MSFEENWKTELAPLLQLNLYFQERTALEERIGTRRAMLEQKIIEEREQMGEMRRLKKEQIRDRHSQERHRLENHFVRTGSTSRSSGGIAPGVGNSSSIQMAM